jgi:hypothetical protein
MISDAKDRGRISGQGPACGFRMRQQTLDSIERLCIGQTEAVTERCDDVLPAKLC